jgi:hypothetical protein
MNCEREWIIFLKQYVLNCNDFEILSTCFDLKIRHAAQIFGVSLSFFKKRCRKCGIKRWPNRKITYLTKLKDYINESEIDECISNITHKPDYEIPKKFDIIRQKIYKKKSQQKIKKRNRFKLF